jgi:teichuronic acid biosynthesis glycosyltransferase TuaG
MIDTATMRENLFNEDPLYKAREDYDCWLRCHQALGKSIKINHPLIGYRQSPGQISAGKFKMMRRHYHVLARYKLASGRHLGMSAALFTCSHFASALYYRRVLGKL